MLENMSVTFSAVKEPRKFVKILKQSYSFEYGLMSIWHTLYLPCRLIKAITDHQNNWRQIEKWKDAPNVQVQDHKQSI